MSQNTIYGPGGYEPSLPYGNAILQWDDGTRTVRDYAMDTSRPYTADENAAADARVAARQQAATRDALAADTTADLTKLRGAIDALALLLADNATVGSIRAWKAPITNGQTVTGAQAKALADLLIADAQATRRIARQTLRLARSMVGDYSSADVGTE